MIIVIDHHGDGDLGCMGADDLRTPHLDAPVANAVLCTSWHVSSPVRSTRGFLPGHASHYCIPGLGLAEGSIDPGTNLRLEQGQRGRGD